MNNQDSMESTPPKTNMEPQNGSFASDEFPFQQPAIFEFYMSFLGGVAWLNIVMISSAFFIGIIT